MCSIASIPGRDGCLRRRRRGRVDRRGAIARRGGHLTEHACDRSARKARGLTCASPRCGSISSSTSGGSMSSSIRATKAGEWLRNEIDGDGAVEIPFLETSLALSRHLRGCDTPAATSAGRRGLGCRRVGGGRVRLSAARRTSPGNARTPTPIGLRPCRSNMRPRDEFDA